MSDQLIDFDPPVQEDQQDAMEQQDISGAARKIASLNARAVMPDGQVLGRTEILTRLGLDPTTPPTAWLNIVVCGSNASALLPGDLQRVAVARVSNASTVLKRVQELGGETKGFLSGGSALR